MKPREIIGTIHIAAVHRYLFYR